jgi:uncharacterized protein with PIN domain
MGVHDRNHAGQLLASQRRVESTTPDSTCSVCNTPLGESGDDERIEHTVPSGTGDTRTDQYCSPSCFVRQMERVGNIE